MSAVFESTSIVEVGRHAIAGCQARAVSWVAVN